MFNKKGVSEVVANVLIVLLVIVGIAVIWSVVKPTIDKGAQGVQADCFTVSVEPVSCAIAGTTATVNVKRNPGAGDFTNVDVVLENAAGDTRKVSPATAVSSTTLTELSTTPIAVTIPSGFTATKANIAITAGGQLCQVTTQPIDCI